MGEIYLYLLMIAVGTAFLIWFFGRIVSTKKKKDALHESASKKDCSEWTKEEREVELERLRAMYSAGQLTHSQYLALKAKYSGEELSRADMEMIRMMREHEMMGKK